MLRKFLLRLKTKHILALREQKGQSIIIFTFAVMGLIAMLGLALDLGLVYIERVKVGRTTDAATLAAVNELSNNNEQAAMERAIEYIRLNGYDVNNGVGDTEIRVRGCVATALGGGIGPGNVNENGNYPTPNPSAAMPKTTGVVTGALYIAAKNSPPRAVFMIDTGSYQGKDTVKNCNPPTSYGGNPQKIQVAGLVNVHMSFMQFFGFSDVPVADEAIAENITSLDVVVVFDISGSMEDQTNCIDCWVRTTYNITNTHYPLNGYFNPIPYDPNLAPGTPNQSVPESRLCTDVPTPWLQKNGTITYSYLSVEAELYSANYSNWNLGARTPGQGFWVLQRGSEGSTFPSGVDATDENGERQGNRAGDPNYQSSNVCNPALPNGINCKPTINSVIDDVCSSDGAISRDCSAYLSAHPYNSYGQTPGNIPNQNGAAYNLDCFRFGAGPYDLDLNPVLSGRCWSNDRTSDNKFLDKLGPGPSSVPWVEYDFTPVWTQTTTYIWIRAIGGNTQSYNWAGSSPDGLDGSPNNNLYAWNNILFWQINNGEVTQRTGDVQTVPDWRDTRADATQWRWILLGSTPTVSGTQYTLKLYQGSAGYKVDKIVFTNDNASAVPPAMRRNLTNGTETNDGRLAFGPPASYGSATRDACNRCNPIYGNTVVEAQCTCLQNYAEVNKRLNPLYPGYDPTFRGTGLGCGVIPPGSGTYSTLANVISMTVSPPEVQPPQVQTRTVVNDLYVGLQPMRSAQEAVKNFILGIGVEDKYRLKPGFDQVGFVAFTVNVMNGTNGSSRAKLQCLRTMSPTPTDPSLCYGKVLAAVERQWPNWGTNISEGMREGLEELGLSIGHNSGVNSDCGSGVDDKKACDRQGSAKRVLILMTDGSPNELVTNCSTQAGYGDFWGSYAGEIGEEDSNFECAMYYAQQAAANGVVVYTIGIGAGANGDFLETMATGWDPQKARGAAGSPVQMFPGASGKYFPAAKPSDLDGIFRQILSSISVRIVS